MPSPLSIPSPVATALWRIVRALGAKHLTKWQSHFAVQSVLSRKLKQLDAVRTIWSWDRNVSLTSVFCPTRLLDVEDVLLPLRANLLGHPYPSNVVNSAADVVDRHVLIVGTAGQGKSLLLR